MQRGNEQGRWLPSLDQPQDLIDSLQQQELLHKAQKGGVGT